MKFRFYQLMYVASLVLTVLALLAPVAGFVEADGAVAAMTNFKYTAADGEVSRSVIALGILLAFTSACLPGWRYGSSLRSYCVCAPQSFIIASIIPFKV